MRVFICVDQARWGCCGGKCLFISPRHVSVSAHFCLVVSSFWEPEKCCTSYVLMFAYAFVRPRPLQTAGTFPVAALPRTLGEVCAFVAAGDCIDGVWRQRPP